MRDAFDRVFEVGVVPGEIERTLVIPERLLHLPAALQNLRQSTNSSEVVWHPPDDDLDSVFAASSWPSSIRAHRVTRAER